MAPRSDGNQLRRVPRFAIVLLFLAAPFAPAGGDFGQLSRAAAPSADATKPQVFTIDPAVFAAAKARVAAGDPAIKPALAYLIREAEHDLKTPVASVMDKPKPGPSGDKHDYVSYAPYWWPDPKTKDGVPYIRKDGYRNEELIRQGDAQRFEPMQGAVGALGLAFGLTGKEVYAQHAAGVLRAWFLDPATRMNPRFDGAQIVLGRNDGRGAGLVEFHQMPQLVDALGLLRASPAWTADDQKRMTEWLTAYNHWLHTDDGAADEQKAKNNHGCWFDVQQTSLLLYLGQREEARQVAEAFKKRIASQVEPDGRLPLEIARTDGWSYTLFDLTAMFTMARLAERVGVDLWHYQTPDGRSLRKALDYVAPYADSQKKWPHNQRKSLQRTKLAPLLIEADAVYGKGSYRKWLELLPKDAVSESRAALWVGR